METEIILGTGNVFVDLVLPDAAGCCRTADKDAPGDGHCGHSEVAEADADCRWSGSQRPAIQRVSADKLSPGRLLS